MRRAGIGAFIVAAMVLVGMARGADAPAPPPPAGADRGMGGMELLMCTAMAPCTIHVHATVDDTKALFTRYQWDFGDPKSQHNVLVGFNAAHFYQAPGRYTITLTRTDDTGARTFTTNVEISPDHRKKFFVSTHGSDAGDGLTEETAFRTVERANKAIADDTGVYFKRGEVFDVTSGISVDKRNVVIGAFGDTDAPPPVLRKANEGMQEIVATRAKAADVVVRDVCVDSQWGDNLDKRGAARGVWASGRNITAHHIEFRNVSDAVNAELKPHGLLIEDCRCPLVTSLRAYLLWGQGEDLVVLSNFAANSTREHIVRLGGAERVLISGNDFANVDRRQEGDKDDIAKGCLVFQKCAYVYATGNSLHGGGSGVGPLGGRDGTKDAEARARFVVMDANRAEGDGMGPTPGSEHVMYRNNLLHVNDIVAFNVRPVDEVKREDGSPAYADRTITDLWFVHNTVINDAKNGRFISVEGAAQPGSIAVIGNLYVAPHWETGYNQNAAVMVTKADLTQFSAIANNVWPVPVKSNPEGATNYVYPTWFSEAGYLTMAQWLAKSPPVSGDIAENVTVDNTGAPSADSKAAHLVPPMPGVFVDINGKTRPAGPRTAGAVEAAGS